ncbi:hypothetical protein [Niallia sp. Krafla_26]|uniref:hypothetical protein n=1 Tax=Niallia sp. Krafla_26 TaxID=3064703 RepID=UPI003D16B6AD
MKKSLIILVLFLIPFSSQVLAMENELRINKEQPETIHFKDLQIIKIGRNYEVTGMAKVRKGVFYYSVENGHHVLVPEKKVKLNNLNWVHFKLKISIPSQQLPKNGVLMLNLYEKDKRGKIAHSTPIVLDSFK